MALSAGFAEPSHAWHWSSSCVHEEPILLSPCPAPPHSLEQLACYGPSKYNWTRSWGRVFAFSCNNCDSTHETGLACMMNGRRGCTPRDKLSVILTHCVCFPEVGKKTKNYKITKKKSSCGFWKSLTLVLDFEGGWLGAWVHALVTKRRVRIGQIDRGSFV